MSTEVIGRCFICKRELTRHDISYTEEGKQHPSARYYEKWPGDHVCCMEHPGVISEYEAAMLNAAAALLNEAKSHVKTDHPPS